MTLNSGQSEVAVVPLQPRVYNSFYRATGPTARSCLGIA